MPMNTARSLSPARPRMGPVLRIARFTLRAVAGVMLAALLLVIGGWQYFHPAITREASVVYGRRHGHDLTFDVLRPKPANGLAVVAVVSGGWKSHSNSFSPALVAPLLRRGYTVFPVYHLSQPEATVAEIFEDVSRAVRRIRHDAGGYSVDPARLGVTGGSAGGHLGLLLATRGGPGPSDAPDPVDRESSAVQAVAVFYPVTDLLDLGDSTENLHDGGPPKSFVQAFRPEPGASADWARLGRALSPLHQMSSNRPPTLIYHGDADTLVPLDQSVRYQRRARELGNIVELVVHHGGSHGWLSMPWDLRRFADWFDDTLQ